MQKWIGKSTGAEIQFKIDQMQEGITVFTFDPILSMQLCAFN